MKFLKNIIIILLALLLISLTIVMLFQINAIHEKSLQFITNDLYKTALGSKFSLLYFFTTGIASCGIIAIMIIIFSDIVKKMKLKDVSTIQVKTDDSAEQEQLRLQKIAMEEEQKRLFAEKAQNLKAGIISIASKTNDINNYADLLLIEFAKYYEIVQGEFFKATSGKDSNKILTSIATFACVFDDERNKSYEFGEGLIGQVAKNKKILVVDNVPQGYITVASGLGSATPSNLVIIPLLANNEVCGIIELASFIKFTKQDEELLQEVANIIGAELLNKTDE